jgi:hypothetical protein
MPNEQSKMCFRDGKALQLNDLEKDQGLWKEWLRGTAHAN